MSITKETIRRCLRDKREEIERAEIIPRPFDFEENGNYVMVGLRHVGKSYMLYQRVRQLLSSGHGWDEILFVDFDDERLAELQTDDLNTLIEVHLEDHGKRPYIFLDEIQNIPSWEKFARRLANEKYHVYVTGSNAKMLSKDVATTLGGRFLIVDIYPFSFKEYLLASGITLSAGWQHSTSEKSEVIRCFRDYFCYGGLPEILQFKQKRAMLSGLYQKIYLGDICQRNNIRSPKVLNILIKKLAESVNQPISYNRLKNIVVSTGCQTSIPTVIDYTTYAEDSWLIIPIENELAKLAEKESTKKYYFIDNGLLGLFLLDGETSLLENLVALQLLRTYGKENVSYYNSTNEIDFVVAEAKIAIQVCYKADNEGTLKREITPLITFGKKHPDWQLLIISYDEERQIEKDSLKIDMIPAWRWLMG